MEEIGEYDPIQWPPDLKLAKVHMKCVCPGRDNAEGIECPCCSRLEKVKVSKWLRRDILKDFKNYGGGVPTYFELMKYCGVAMTILAIIVIIYHVYILETVCEEITAGIEKEFTGPLSHQQELLKRETIFKTSCQSFLFIFRFCQSKEIINTLNQNNKTMKANIFFGLQLFSYIFLITATIGMKFWIQRVNRLKIVREEKVYSNYSLMIKNIPKFYKIDDVRKELELIVPGVEICEIFFVYEIAELENKYKKLFDLHFEVEFMKESVGADRGGTRQELDILIREYGILYEEIEFLKAKLVLNNGRAIAVFNDQDQRDAILKSLQINEAKKLVFHISKLLGQNTQKLHFFADKIAEPQEILWKYIGESSVTKTQVRIKTTVIGIGFIIVAFLILYFPIVRIDSNSVLHRSITTSVLSILISLILQTLSIVYRQVILYILPSRHPSSRDSESYFVVITTIVFHFFFYIIAPGAYFLIGGGSLIPSNVKLKQLFVAVVMFLLMSVIVAFIDLRYRLFNAKRKRIMNQWTGWGKYCQMRLHEEIRWPSFPIEFKLMVLMNIWSFNAFYVFEIPYLLFLFVVVIFIIFFIDKKNIYQHYKMQVYQSIELELMTQRSYIVMFLICLSCGYAATVTNPWQYYMIGVIFVISLCFNFFIEYKSNKREEKQVNRTMTLAQAIKAQSGNPKQSMMMHLMESDFKENALMLENMSSISIGSAALQYGYKELYDSYLNQFKNKQILHLLESTYKEYTNPEYNVEEEIEAIRRNTQLSRLSEIKSKSNDGRDSNAGTDKADEIELS